MYGRNRNARLLTGGLVGVQPGYGDEHWDDVTLLLGGSSTTDLSIAGNALTNYGATTPSVTGPYGSTQNVLDFDKTGATTTTGNYLETGVTDDFKFGTSPFTIEMWLKPDITDTSSQTANLAAILEYDQSAAITGAWFALHQNNSELYFYTNSGNTLVNTTSGGLSTSSWSHVAIVRDVGNTLTIYVNGVSKGSGALSHNMSDAVSRNLFIGKQYNVTRHYDGQIADIRITKGVARYTSNFTPPAASLPTNAPVVGRRGVGTYDAGDEHWNDVTLLLNGEDATIADVSSASTALTFTTPTSVTQSTSVYKYDSGSLRFTNSGAGGAAGNSIAYGSTGTEHTLSGDYTVEFWWRPDNLLSTTANDNIIWDSRNASKPNYPAIIYSGGATANFPRLMLFIDGGERITSSQINAAQQWYHVALVRSGSTYTMYLNGTSQGTHGATASVSSTHYIGRRFQAYNSNYFGTDGYLDDFRLTPGVARYTSNFTPPTESFPTALTGAPEATKTRRTRGYIGAAPAEGGMLTLYDRYVDNLS